MILLGIDGVARPAAPLARPGLRDRQRIHGDDPNAPLPRSPTIDPFLMGRESYFGS